MDAQCLNYPSPADRRKCLGLPRRNAAYKLLDVDGLCVDGTGRPITQRAKLQVPNCPAIDSYLEEIRNTPGIVGLSSTFAWRPAEKSQNSTMSRRNIQIAVRGSGFYQHVPRLKSGNSACLPPVGALREQSRARLTRSKTETWHIPQSLPTNRGQSSLFRLSPVDRGQSRFVRSTPIGRCQSSLIGSSPINRCQFSLVRSDDIGQSSLGRANQHQQMLSSPSFNPHPFDDSALKVAGIISRNSHSKHRQRKSCLGSESPTKNLTFNSSGFQVHHSLNVNHVNTQTSSGKTKRKKRKRLRKRKKWRGTSLSAAAPNNLQNNPLVGMVSQALGPSPVSSEGETRLHLVDQHSASRNLVRAELYSSDLPSQLSGWTGQILASSGQAKRQPVPPILCPVPDSKRAKRLRRLRITGQALETGADSSPRRDHLIKLDTGNSQQMLEK